MAEGTGSDVVVADRPAADLLGALITQAAEVLRAARSAVVVGHINPDGDALGSVFAVTATLRTLGVPAIPTWGARHEGEDPTPLDPAWDFLPHADAVRHPGALPSECDVVVACDTAAASRLGTAEGVLARAGTVIVLDHHAVGDGFGDLRVVDDTASCTGVLALRLIDELGVPLTRAIADALYLALLTDTGRFSFASTTAEDHRVAARLLDAGADHVAIARAVYDSASAGYLDLVARVTGRASIDDRVVASFVTQQDLEETATGEHEPDGLIDLLRKVDGVDVTCFLRQTTAGTWRSSLRSRGATDVAAIAHRMGGGGHRMAAGFTGHGDPHDILDEVRQLLADAPLEEDGR
jgi:phosphoesterase RecJ-like protein